jgi:hypothetical protein
MDFEFPFPILKSRFGTPLHSIITNFSHFHTPLTEAWIAMTPALFFSVFLVILAILLKILVGLVTITKIDRLILLCQ